MLTYLQFVPVQLGLQNIFLLLARPGREDGLPGLSFSEGVLRSSRSQSDHACRKVARFAGYAIQPIA